VRSLYGKLSLAFCGTLVLVAAVLFGLGLRGAELYGKEVRQRLNRDVAHHIAKNLHPFEQGKVSHASLKPVFMDAMVVNPSLEVYLLDASGRVLAYDAPEEKIERRSVALAPIRTFLADSSDRLLVGDDPRDARGRKPFTVAPVTEGETRRGYLYIILGGEVYDSIAGLLRTSHILKLCGLLALVVILLGALVAFVASKRLTRPLRTLRDAMARFRHDREPSPLSIESNDEIGELVKSYNGLVERVVENALRHTDAGGTVEVRMRRTRDGVGLRVSDTGCGIPADKVDRIFDRSYRVDESRPSQAGGSGLGLAITKRILDLHETRISVTSRLRSGTTFQFALCKA